jgi:hypothetical protein
MTFRGGVIVNMDIFGVNRGVPNSFCPRTVCTYIHTDVDRYSN